MNDVMFEDNILNMDHFGQFGTMGGPRTPRLQACSDIKIQDFCYQKQKTHN